MKKIFVILSVIVSMVMLASCGAENRKHDFRNVDFGMTAAELIAAEGEPDQQLSDMYIYFDREVYGIPHAELTYEIDETGICDIRVTIANKYSDDKSYIEEYHTVKENLIKEWGEPDLVSENEEEFEFMCSWNHDYLMLYKGDDGSVRISCRCFPS